MGINILSKSTWSIWSSVWHVSKIYDDSRGDLQINTECDLVLLIIHTNFRLCQKWWKNFACISLASEPMTYKDSKLPGFHREFIRTTMRDGNMNYDGYVRIWKVQLWADINNPQSVSHHQKGKENIRQKGQQTSQNLNPVSSKQNSGVLLLHTLVVLYNWNVVSITKHEAGSTENCRESD